MTQTSRLPEYRRNPEPVIPPSVAPDLVIVGAARSGTSFLAAQLGAHPNIDPGSLKEPNFFSRNFERGYAWYEALFQPRQDGVLRMDASVSYTFPQFPEAVDRLALHAGNAYIVYVVRDPIPRAVSHYLYHRHYFGQESAPDFGAGIHDNRLYCGASDYRRWIDALYERFPRDRVLLVPFRAVSAGDVDAQVCARLKLPDPEGSARADAHKNNVVTFKHEILRVASRKLRRSRLYPAVRQRLGADRLRRIRSLVTREAQLPTYEEAMTSCSPDQREELAALEARSRAAVTTCLAEQDQRIGVSWSAHWSEDQR